MVGFPCGDWCSLVESCVPLRPAHPSESGSTLRRTPALRDLVRRLCFAERTSALGSPPLFSSADRFGRPSQHTSFLHTLAAVFTFNFPPSYSLSKIIRIGIKYLPNPSV